MKELGYLKDKVYYLTDEGKKVIVSEVNNRIYNSTENTYSDCEFEILIRYIISNYDSRLDKALYYNVKKIDSTYTKHLKISKNKRNLELWFEANYSEANYSEANLTGKDIVDYFLSDDYSYITEKFNLSYTIRELTSFLNNNVMLQSEKASSSEKPKSI